MDSWRRRPFCNCARQLPGRPRCVPAGHWALLTATHFLRPGVSGDADVCTSGRVLLAFTWMPAILRKPCSPCRRAPADQSSVMIYLVLLLCGVIIHQKYDPEIWHASAREFCRTKTRQLLSSTPVSPVLPRFKGIAALEIVAPQPKLPAPAPATAYSHRAGMGPDYGIEFYSPTGERDITSLQQAKQTVQRTATMAMAPTAVPAPSLYPIHTQSSVQPSGQPPLRTPGGSSPPPLGSWPRADAVNQPVRKNSKRKPVPTGWRADVPATAPPAGTAPEATVTSTRPRTQRKRTLSGEMHRPPPLDLTKISSFN